MREDSRTDEALHDSKCTEAEVRTKHGEKPVEERHGPPDLGEKEYDDLEYDEESVEDGPKDASRFIRHSAIGDIVTIDQPIRTGRVGSASCNKIIDGFNVVDHGHDATRKHEQACDDRENASAVQANEYICARGKHYKKFYYVSVGENNMCDNSTKSVSVGEERLGEINTRLM